MAIITRKFHTLSSALLLFLLKAEVNGETTGNLRSDSRNLQISGSVPDFVCDLFPFLCSEPENCPDVKALGDDSFDLDVYIERSWFIQKQQLNPYQDLDNLYCVVATYDRRKDGKVQVHNFANTNRINAGDSETNEGEDDFFGLCAEQLDAGQIQVAPCIFGIDPLPSVVFDIFAGPYWVVAVSDPGTDNYEWAIVSGGEVDIVKEEDPTLCTTSNGLLYTDALQGSGLWLFTRDRVANETVIGEMMDELASLGIYSGDLKDVTQDGCTYENAYIKT